MHLEVVAHLHNFPTQSHLVAPAHAPGGKPLQFPSMIGSRLIYCISRPTIASVGVAIGAAATAVTKIARRNFMIEEGDKRMCWREKRKESRTS
jgi:hypothetical protein